MNIERWGLFECRLNSPTQYENPFRDVTLTAAFTCEAGTKTVEGFYDGDDTWVIRFMPEHLGTYSFQTASSDSALDRRTGSFVCIAPSVGNHGPVHVDKQYHFSYADGDAVFSARDHRLWLDLSSRGGPYPDTNVLSKIRL